jgi:hypothetical protein
MEVKTISSDYIIQRLMANHSINNTDWYNDSKDWIAQAVRFIGKHAGLDVTICCNVFVENYKTCYPPYMEGLLAVMKDGFLLPLGSNLAGAPISRDFNTVKNQIASQANIIELNKLQAQKETLMAEYAVTPVQEIADKINEVAYKIDSYEKIMSAEHQFTFNRGRIVNADYYNTKIDYLQTSFETGYIDLIIASFPVDEQGFLKVLDNEFYIQAIEWYLLLMLVQKGYKHDIFTYDFCYTMFWGGNKLEPIGWRAKAANNVRIPTIQEAERFTRMWEQARFRRDLPIQLFDRTEQLTGLIY